MGKSSYRDLVVWQAAMQLAVDVYALTDRFPRQEVYGLAHQMRRAALSIPSNIAEGYGRKTHKQRFSFLENALGSLFELETQVELAARLGCAPTETIDLTNDIRQLGKGIAALMRFVERDSRNFVPLRP
jgi:four helix bundle protein